MATMTVEMVTGERVVYQDSGVELVSAPGTEGRLGILPNHASLISTLDAGDVRIRKGGRDEHFVVFGGFIQVSYNRVIILADNAERVEDIDLERARQTYEHTRERLERSQSAEEMAAARAAHRRAEVRLRAAQNGRTGAVPRP